MKFRSLAFAGIGAGALLWASGFPRRVGLTRSQAAVSLPGDLLLPGANVVVDRGIEIPASVSHVWSVIDTACEADEESLVAREKDSHIITRLSVPGGVVGEDFYGTCVIAVEPVTDSRTIVHVRERYAVSSTREAVYLHAVLVSELPATMGLLRDIRQAAVMCERQGR